MWLLLGGNHDSRAGLPEEDPVPLESITVTLCSLLGSLVTLLLLGRKRQALKSRNLRGAGRGGLMAPWSLYQWNSHLHHGPFRAPLRAAVAVLGPSDTSSPGPIQDPRSRVNHVPLYALSQVTCPGTLAMTQICFLLSGWPWTVGSS